MFGQALQAEVDCLKKVLVGLTVVSQLAGCGAKVAPTPTTTVPASTAPAMTATPGPTSTAPVSTATPGPTTTPTAAAAVTPVAGTVTCPSVDLGTITTDADGVTHYRGGTFRCVTTSNDPRVTGTGTASWNMDLWGTAENGANVQWGTTRLENHGGAWVGTGSGVYSSGRGDIIASWYKGTGGYAGLGYFELWTGKGPWTTRGLIFVGDAPDLTGLPPVSGPAPSPNVPPGPTAVPRPTPTAIAYGPVSVTEGTSAYTVVDLDNNTFAGIVTSNDPRSSGEYLAPNWTLDFVQLPGYDYGMGPQWGPSRLTNAGGTWQGDCSGVYDGSDAFACWYKGTGGYVGLGYFELIVRSDYFGPTGAEVTTGNFGQIFPGDPPTP